MSKSRDVPVIVSLNAQFSAAMAVVVTGSYTDATATAYTKSSGYTGPSVKVIFRVPDNFAVPETVVVDFTKGA